MGVGQAGDGSENQTAGLCLETLDRIDISMENVGASMGGREARVPMAAGINGGIDRSDLGRVRDILNGGLLGEDNAIEDIGLGVGGESKGESDGLGGTKSPGELDWANMLQSNVEFTEVGVIDNGPSDVGRAETSYGLKMMKAHDVVEDSHVAQGYRIAECSEGRKDLGKELEVGAGGVDSRPIEGASPVSFITMRKRKGRGRRARGDVPSQNRGGASGGGGIEGNEDFAKLDFSMVGSRMEEGRQTVDLGIQLGLKAAKSRDDAVKRVVETLEEES